MKILLLKILFAFLLLTTFSVSAQKKVSFGFNSGHINEEFVSEVELFSSLEKALEKPEDVHAVNISASSKSLAEIKQLKNLKYIYLDETFTADSYYLNKEGITALFEIISKIESLEFISVFDPRLLQYMTTMKNIKGIRFNKFDATIYESLASNFPELKILIINDPKISSLPLSFNGLKNLLQLEIYSNALITLPESLGNLPNLIVLKMLTGKALTMPLTFANLKKLKYFKITGSCYFKKFPDAICGMENLVELNIDLRFAYTLPDEIGNLTNLRFLYLNECQNINAIPATIGKLKYLEEIYFSDANSLTRVEELANLVSPFTVLMNRCEYHRIAKSVKDMPNLKAVVVPRSIMPNELARLKEILPEEKILFKDF